MCLTNAYCTYAMDATFSTPPEGGSDQAPSVFGLADKADISCNQLDNDAPRAPYCHIGLYARLPAHLPPIELHVAHGVPYARAACVIAPMLYHNTSIGSNVSPYLNFNS